MNENANVTFEMTEIDTALLISGQPYQRPVKEKHPETPVGGTPIPGPDALRPVEHA